MKELAVSPKQRVEALLKSLPDDCALEDIQYHLLMIQKLEKRIAAADKGNFLSPEDVEKRFNKWLT
ncbi:MAG: hypothetical protein JWL69_473 [Phycisphaerales bacterium]|nr:hypothetical protein [Phycisphaerales bacterium]